MCQEGFGLLFSLCLASLCLAMVVCARALALDGWRATHLHLPEVRRRTTNVSADDSDQQPLPMIQPWMPTECGLTERERKGGKGEGKGVRGGERERERREGKRETQRFF